jgi:endonuclease III
MIDPMNVTDFDRSDAELEEFFLFAVLVANKNSDRMARALDFLLRQGEPGDSPFDTIRRMVLDGSMPLRLIQAKTGEYGRRLKTLTEVATGMVPNLRNAEPEDLEQIHGVGLKTARFFLMHSRRNSQYAAIDTHILKYMREFYGHKVPNRTPTNREEYRELEEWFVLQCAIEGVTPAAKDLEVWKLYSGRVSA